MQRYTFADTLLAKPRKADIDSEKFCDAVATEFENVRLLFEQVFSHFGELWLACSHGGA